MNQIAEATSAVTSQLNVGDFIEAHKEELFDRLEENFERAEKSPMFFITNSLPLISGIVHVGSKQENYRRAIEWASRTHTDTDPITLLSSLTLVYLIHAGLQEFSKAGNYQRARLWNEMERIVANWRTA